MTYKEMYKRMSEFADKKDWFQIILLGNTIQSITCEKNEEFDYFIACVNFTSLAHEFITENTTR